MSTFTVWHTPSANAIGHHDTLDAALEEIRRCHEANPEDREGYGIEEHDGDRSFVVAQGEAAYRAAHYK